MAERRWAIVAIRALIPAAFSSQSTFHLVLLPSPEALFLQAERRLITALLAYNLIPTHSTCSGDPTESGVSVTISGQLVAARSRERCHHHSPGRFWPTA